MKIIRALDRQRHIYAQGATGRKPRLPVDPFELERQARRTMTSSGFAYIAGGAGLEDTMAANRREFSRWQIMPRFLRDVEHRDPTTVLFGQPWPSPFFLAPVGALELAHAEADLAVARAAGSLGFPYFFSNQASVSMEQCAAAMAGAPRFFQLYWSRSDDLVASLLQRAEACGCTALVLTLDTTLLGWRTRDLALGSLPFLRGKGLAQYFSDPFFRHLVDQPATDHAVPRSRVSLQALQTLVSATRKYPGNFWSNLRLGRGLKAVRMFTRIYSRPNITWADLPFLRRHTRLPIILKGLLHPDDARKALDYGVDGIYVSNHGGRQIDGSIGALAALPAIVETVREKVPVLFDSGVRGGADAFKALALGANAVGIGRPYCYALALRGQAGVEELLTNWMADFELTMALAGCRNIGEIRTAGMVKRDE